MSNELERQFLGAVVQAVDDFERQLADRQTAGTAGDGSGMSGGSMSEPKAKPCTRPGCNGTMRYEPEALPGRERATGTGVGAGDIAWQKGGAQPAWVCDVDSRHLEPA